MQCSNSYRYGQRCSQILFCQIENDFQDLGCTRSKIASPASMRGLLHLVEVRLACVISAGELLKQRVVLEDRDQAVKLVALLCVPPSRTITHQPPRTFFFALQTVLHPLLLSIAIVLMLCSYSR